MRQRLSISLRPGSDDIITAAVDRLVYQRRRVQGPRGTSYTLASQTLSNLPHHTHSEASYIHTPQTQPTTPTAASPRDPPPNPPRVVVGGGGARTRGVADCAVGSGEWAEPPHSPWTLRRRYPKKANFSPFFGCRGSFMGRPEKRKNSHFWALEVGGP